MLLERCSIITIVESLTSIETNEAFMGDHAFALIHATTVEGLAVAAFKVLS